MNINRKRLSGYDPVSLTFRQLYDGLKSLKDERFPKISRAVADLVCSYGLLEYVDNDQYREMQGFIWRHKSGYTGYTEETREKLAFFEKKISRHEKMAEVPLIGWFFKRGLNTAECTSIQRQIAGFKAAQATCIAYEAKNKTWKSIEIIDNDDRLHGRISPKGAELMQFLARRLSNGRDNDSVLQGLAEWQTIKLAIYNAFSAKALTLEQLSAKTHSPEYVFNRVVLDIVADHYFIEDMDAIADLLQEFKLNTPEHQVLVASILCGQAAQEKYQDLRRFLQQINFKLSAGYLRLICQIINIPKKTLEEKRRYHAEIRDWELLVQHTKLERQLLTAVSCQRETKQNSMLEFALFFRAGTKQREQQNKDYERGLFIGFVMQDKKLDSATAAELSSALEESGAALEQESRKQSVTVRQPYTVAVIGAMLGERKIDFIKDHFYYYKIFLTAGYDESLAEFLAILLNVKVHGKLAEKRGDRSLDYDFLLKALTAYPFKQQKKPATQEMVRDTFGLFANQDWIY